jgi:hypothetical protein
MDNHLELMLDAKAALGEGPGYDVDIGLRMLHDGSEYTNQK